MRILHVVHDFLPGHVAGVEVYTDHVTRHLARDHDVGLLFTESRPGAPDHALCQGRHGDVTTWEIVNNHAYGSFDETYRNPAIEARVCEVLDAFRPDVVHVQHLINLSLGVLDECGRRGIPVVMTLHEHWLACANGGQRFHRDLGRCDVLDARRCGACAVAREIGPGDGRWARLMRHAPVDPATDQLALARVQPHVIETPDARFVYRDRYVLHGVARDTWVAHPPARLGFDVIAGPDAVFTAHLAMHPSTFEIDGGAVRFEVRVDGAPVAELRLDPRRNPLDRTPRPLRAGLSAGRHHLELCTEVDPREAAEFATAGWIEPRIAGARLAPRDLRERGVRRAARFFDGLALGPLQDARRAIERRWSAVRASAASVDRFLLPSQHLRAEMIRFGLPAERLIHCDYGFPVERFERRAEVPDVARHFAFIGSVMRHKGMHVLLEAFEGLPADARLSVAGSPSYDPSYTAWLRDAARHPGVRFLGAVPPDDVPAFLASADALVVPSIWQENSPLTIHEGFLAGIPVVASRMGGSTELLAGGGGLLYDADDPLALRAALRRLYEEHGLARRLAASAPPVKSMKDHAAELLDLYDRVRHERGARSGD